MEVQSFSSMVLDNYKIAIGLGLIILIVVVIKLTCRKKIVKANHQEQKINIIQPKTDQVKIVKEVLKSQYKIIEEVKMKSLKEMEQEYSNEYIGSISLKQSNSIHYITALKIKSSKILLSTTKNQLILYDLKKWRKDKEITDKYYTSLENNTATALAIGNKYYYVALGFDKTIAYYQFIGEGKVYFRLINRFKNNILQSETLALMVPDNEKYIVSAGKDTVVEVWSMEGQRLSHVNSYQNQLYGVDVCNRLLLIRGWTSEVKLFNTIQDKQGNFIKCEKSSNLPHKQSPICSNIDNMGLYAITASKGLQISLWNLKMQTNTASKNIELNKLNLKNIKLCHIHTKKYQNERLKTIIILSDGQIIVLCDRNFNLCGRLEGVQCKQLFTTNSQKSTIMYVINNQYRVTIWNLNKYLENIQEYVDAS